MPSALPIEEIRPTLTEALVIPGQSVVIKAPTGSGKSTQVPQMVLDDLGGALGDIVVLQPRRIAARMLAARVSAERRTRLGEEVGYQVRFERVVSPKTRIRFVTEGILLRRMLSDPTLKGTSVVLFDEFHERHLDADIGLARCRQLQQSSRPDLKLIVMSATLDAANLETFLEPCQIIESAGRTFPVKMVYRPQGGRDMPLWDKMVRAAREAASHEGDMLMFLPGSFEIQKTISALGREKWARDREVLPLYGDLPPNQQDAAVAPNQRRKIIVATNVAETSLTIDGVCVVIDSGLVRLPNYDATRGLNTLTIQPISQASADQRAGRAGRTAPGVCYRLWAESHHHTRASHEAPEIHRLDLAETILHLKRIVGHTLETFPWFETPDPITLKRALTLLGDLGAIDRGSGEITDHGRRMTDFPVAPRYARLLVEAEQLGRPDDWIPACLFVALAQCRPLFPKGKAGHAARQRFMEPGDRSDFLPLWRGFQGAAGAGFRLETCRQLGVHAGAAREVDRLFKMLVKRGGYAKIPEGSFQIRVADLLLPAFPDQIAVRRGVSGKVFDVSGGRRGQLSPETVVESKTRFVVAAELTEIEGKELNVILGAATAVTEDDLRRHFPNDFHTEEGARYEESGRRVVAERRVLFRDLVLERKQAGEPPADEAAQLLARQVVNGILKLKLWNHGVESWLARVRLLQQAMPELELPEFTEEDRLLIVTEICQGAFTYKQIKDRPVLPSVKQWLSPPLQTAIESYAPEQVTLTNGTRAKIDYVSDPEPTISVILQRLYDVNDTPTIAGGRVPLKVQILAPNQRPAQVTTDLRGFWENSYEAVKTQLKGRYPKHEWR